MGAILQRKKNLYRWTNCLVSTAFQNCSWKNYPYSSYNALFVFPINQALVIIFLSLSNFLFRNIYMVRPIFLTIPTNVQFIIRNPTSILQMQMIRVSRPWLPLIHIFLSKSSLVKWHIPKPWARRRNWSCNGQMNCLCHRPLSHLRTTQHTACHKKKTSSQSRQWLILASTVIPPIARHALLLLVQT